MSSIKFLSKFKTKEKIGKKTLYVDHFSIWYCGLPKVYEFLFKIYTLSNKKKLIHCCPIFLFRKFGDIRVRDFSLQWDFYRNINKEFFLIQFDLQLNIPFKSLNEYVFVIIKTALSLCNIGLRFPGKNKDNSFVIKNLNKILLPETKPIYTICFIFDFRIKFKWKTKFKKNPTLNDRCLKGILNFWINQKVNKELQYIKADSKTLFF